ncbi:glycosyl transferase family 28 [Nakamurella sp. YIM 132087]|uniref:Glycosyl transferase family 28 n=1 Tax=Nakamurella alba TaxID=2665158 RepID=A0A7K1FNX5_9ACTN|nr:glycosyltransferase [Nakamurella alba]MTD15846.1 glycosyl transferase family 28 [Nakamurella alba]
MGRILLVCSGGGHLKQLFTLAGRMGIAPEDQLWVTFDTGLSRSLLEGRDVQFARYAAPRDIPGTIRNAALARRMLRSERFDLAVSTGSSLAVSFLPLAARKGVPSHFIETAARADGPSMSGKILQRVRSVQTYTQYPAWSGPRWQYRGSTFDQYDVGPAVPSTDFDRVRKVVVTVGTTESYGFERLLTALVPLLGDREVLWQTGRSDVSALGIEGRESVPHHELNMAIAEADLVISHSGTGAALSAMEHGKTPVLVPRLARHDEHIDDHQLQIASELQRRGLAVMAHVEELDEQLLARAAGMSTVRLDVPPPFELIGSPGPSARL